MGNLIQDLKYGLRMLAKNPGFTGVAVITLALGIGANTAIFSVMNAVILRYLPVPDPQQLAYLNTTGWPSGALQTGHGSLSFNEQAFEQLRTQRQVFSDLVAFVPLNTGKVAVRYGEEPEEAQADMVSGNFFSGLGVQPARGRTFTLRDEAEHTQMAVLSYAYWTRRFDRNPSAVGQTLFVKGVPFTIVGVAAREFTGVEGERSTDVWIPLQNRPDVKPWGRSAQDEDSFYGSPNWWFLMMIGRLAPGVTRQQALSRLTPVFQRAAYAGIGTRDTKERPPQVYFSSTGGLGKLEENYKQPILVVMAMVGLLLVIACSNVAMLLVARNTSRQREFTLRTALGAGRARLFRQLLTESLLLVAGGAALGWVLAQWASDAMASWTEIDLNVAPDRTVLFFTLIISLLAALAFGLAPLRNALRVPAGLALRASWSTAYADRKNFRSGQFVVGLQVCLCLVLLVGATLLARTLRNLEAENLGFRAKGLLVFGITPPQTAHTDAEVIRFYQALMNRLRTLPGVESATLMQNRIGSGWSNNELAIVDGVNPRGKIQSMMRWNAVGSDYFQVLGTNLLLGRDFTDADSAGAPRVAIINQTFAQRYLPGRSPLGHHLALSERPGSTQYAIIGIVADSKYTGVRESKVPMAYFPYTQRGGVATMHVELRTRGNPTALLPDVRRAVHEFGLDLPLLQPMTQQKQFEESFSQERLFARLSMSFGLLAALLVATGLYGTLAYRVSRRTAEIGVRMALGAQRGQVLWMVLREGLVVGVAGTLVGLPLAMASARLLRSMLFGVGPGDPVTITAALAGIIAVTLTASLIPARRATKVDPMVALRYE